MSFVNLVSELYKLVLPKPIQRVDKPALITTGQQRPALDFAGLRKDLGHIGDCAGALTVQLALRYDEVEVFRGGRRHKIGPHQASPEHQEKDLPAACGREPPQTTHHDATPTHTRTHS